MSTISGSRAALSISVMPLASTAAISRFSVAPTLGKSEPDRGAAQAGRRRGDDEAVLAGDLGAHPGQAGHVHVEPAGADGVAAGVRHPHLAAAGQQRAEHADRGAQALDQVVVGLGARLGGRRRVAGAVDAFGSTAQPSRRSTSAMMAMSLMRGTLSSACARAQQSRGHQLQRGVLGAGHLHVAGQAGPALDPDHVHGAIVGAAARRERAEPCLGWSHGRSPHPHLHQDRRRRQTALGDGSRSPRPTRGSTHTPTSTRPTRQSGGARARRAAGRNPRGAENRTERPVRRRRRSMRADHRGPEVAAAAGDRGPTSNAWRAGVTSSTGGWPSWTRSSCRAAPRGPRCCTWPARCAGAPSRPGPCWRPTRTGPTRSPRSTSTGSRTWFILSRVANPDGDVKWVPGGDRYGPSPAGPTRQAARRSS